MKKILTVLLASSLSLTMLTAMAACNQGKPADQVSNPFDSNTSSASSLVDPSSSVTPVGDNSAASAVSAVSAVSDTSAVAEPSAQTPVSEPDVSLTESSVPVSTSESSVVVLPSTSPTDDDSDEPSDDSSDEESWDVQNSIVPKGSVNPAYAGTYSMKTDFTDDELRAMYGSSMGTEITDEMLQMLKNSLSMMKMTIVLNADGSASADMSAMGENSSFSGGTWSAEGTDVYITIEGSTGQFTFNNGTLTSPEMQGMVLVRQ